MAQLVALFKRGMHEVPHIMYGAAFFATMCAGTIYVAKRHWKYGIEHRNWKRRYTVVREEDFDPSKQVHRSERRYPIY